MSANSYREIVRMISLGTSQRNIADTLHVGRDTVRTISEYLASHPEITWPLDGQFTNAELEKRIFPKRFEKNIPRAPIDFEYIHKELAKKAVTLQLLWTEYCTSCAEDCVPYMYSRFCELYRKWCQKNKCTMRISHKPGDSMEVDWAGLTMTYYEPNTQKEYKAYIFVAVLPCSWYCHVEAFRDMKTPSWLEGHIHAYARFGGVPRLLCPDNLRTGVVKNTREETVLTPSYFEMAEYYKTAIVPCRVIHPQDKSHAEGTVKYISTWIIQALRNRKFLSFEELKSVVNEKCNEINEYALYERKGTRKSGFEEEEKSFLAPLPAKPYEPAEWKYSVKVPGTYCISDGINKYSVPHTYIGEQVDIRMTNAIVEVFNSGNRIACHPRKQFPVRDPVVLKEHMPEKHRRYLEYNAEDFRSWASEIGNNAFDVVDYFLSAGRAPEQGYKACASLTALAVTHGKKRLEEACGIILKNTDKPSIRNISSILRNKRVYDNTEISVPVEEQLPGGYSFSRGSDYYN